MSPAVGVYPVADALTAGDEISSTYEGRHLTLREDELIHPPGGDGLVDKGDPVIVCQAGVQANFGKAIGVAFTDGLSTATMIAIDTEGIWILEVFAEDDGGAGSNVVPGDELFINTTSCVLSKIRNIATQIPFGYALGRIVAGLTETIAVKVHFDPMLDSERILYNTVASGAYGKQTVGLLAAGNSEGVSHYFSGQISGQQDGLIYNVGNWLDLLASYIATGTITTPSDNGIWDGSGADISLARLVFAGQAHAILAAAPASLYAWRLNSTQTITALIAAANPGSVGFVPGTGVASARLGNIPIADVVGTGVVWIRTYAGAN